MPVQYKHAKRLWEILVEKYSISVPVENKSNMYDAMLEEYVSDLLEAGNASTEREARESTVSKASFLDRFYDIVVSGGDPKIGIQVKGKIARLAGYRDWNDFFEDNFGEEIRSRSEEAPSSHLPENIEQLFATTGLTHAYPSRTSAKEDMKADMALAESSIEMYARVYISELVKDPEFGMIIGKLPERSPNVDEPLVIRQYSTDPEDLELSRKIYEIEDPDKDRWQTLEEYSHHINWGHQAFLKNCFKGTKKYLDDKSRIPEDKRRKLSFERAYIHKSLLPFSMLIIDEKVIYVSFYSLSSNRYGTFAPTMRLLYQPCEKTTWAERFLEEAWKVQKHFTRDIEKLGEI